jgi:DNA-binding IclR family transcriptional regulator
MPAAPRRYRIKVVEKALAILDLFGDSPGDLTLTQIGERLGMSKPTAFRIINVLEQGDYLERAPGSQGWRLGLKLHRLGSLVESTTAIQRLAHPFLAELAESCHETVHLTVLNKGEALYLDKIEGNHSVRVVSRIGQRLPAHCSGVGKVLLAHLPDDEVEAVVAERGLPRLTPATITQREALQAELRRVRQQGYAIDNEEIEIGLKCVAAPVRDASDRVVAAISVSVPKFRFDSTGQDRFVELIVRTAGRISATLHQGAPEAAGRRPNHAHVDRAPRKQRASARG